jgi:biotin transport system substrate-specific component
VPTPLEIMWAVTGLLLTIGSTFLQPSVVIPSLSGQGEAVLVQQIGVTLQIGAVLLTGCLGGKNAALLAQVAYIFLGLSGFGVFYQGGGIAYVKSPAFGYLLGFIPGAWLCGFLAFLRPPSLERLTISCLLGLLAIHIVGIIYVIIFHFPDLAVMQSTIAQFSFQRLPGQLLVVCATVVLSLAARRLLFY